MLESNIKKIREALEQLKPEEYLLLECFNEGEMEEIKLKLTEKELERIGFEFGYFK